MNGIKVDYKLFLKDVNEICDNLIRPKEKSIRVENNYFLRYYTVSGFFKEQTLIKIKSLYEAYKGDKHSKNVIIENINKLFYYNWEGAYSELSTYYFLNLCFEEKCELQINEETSKLKTEHTLARYYKNKKLTDIDGFNKCIMSFFEIKSLENPTKYMLNKIKKELFSYDNRNNESFNFTFNTKDGFKIKNYDGLVKEIKQGKYDLKKYIQKQEQENKNRTPEKQQPIIKKLVVVSKTNPGLSTTLYINQSILLEMRMEETSYQKAEMFERVPLENPYQFVDGSFIKIFICNGLNPRNEINFDRDFFRALSRRVFIKLTKDENFVPGTDKQLTYGKVAKKLCGLMFITDLTANKGGVRDFKNSKDLYRCFVYLNPNADYKYTEKFFRGFRFYLRNLNQSEVDDFRYDNY